MSTRHQLTVLILAAGLVLSACRDKPAPVPEVTKASRTEAAHLVSEAEFALQLRDFSRAEPLLAKAVGLVPGEGDYWVMLGISRRHLGNTDGARTAYRSALAAFEAAYASEPTSGALLLEQAYVHALLGQVDRARALLEKAGRDHATDPQVQTFIQSRTLDQLLSDRGFRENAL